MAKEQAHHDRELHGSYTVTQQLLPRHYTIQDLHLSGLNYREIALKLSMSLRQVANVINSPQFQHELALRRSHIQDSVDEGLLQAQDEVQTIIKKATTDAANRLSSLLTSENEAVSRQAANDILDRGGYPKVSRTDTTTKQSITLDSEAAAQIEKVLLELTEPPTAPSPPDSQDPPAT